ncbi:hypothetical protein BKA70DRAFT_1451707 [Coprinopsis sp. MPI-PUGE-AT-0042]|nr:hypothetical protein BKA70DRAFT_1451707 [Coprinopsis sp. MPI-PUGE-AT-0042]
MEISHLNNHPYTAPAAGVPAVTVTVTVGDAASGAISSAIATPSAAEPVASGVASAASSAASVVTTYAFSRMSPSMILINFSSHGHRSQGLDALVSIQFATVDRSKNIRWTWKWNTCVVIEV